MIDFDEYKKLGEPSVAEKSSIWQAAIGLQQVDDLQPSEYLIRAAKENIEGKISIYEVKDRLNEYYSAHPVKSGMERTMEADKVSAHIAEILGEKTFNFTPAEYISIHKRLFAGVLGHKIAGKIREYNIEKSEWVLNGETVYYASADSIRDALDYDFRQEKLFKYDGLSRREIVRHIAKFISGIWQIHAFSEGNTRTTAVFAIKYLQAMGFETNNDLFAEHSWYFRNALVRANYQNLEKNMAYTPDYLNCFFGNLLLGEKNVLKNRHMRIGVDIGKKSDNSTDINTDKLSNAELEFLHKVKEFLENNESINNAQAQQLTGKSAETVKKRLGALASSGTLIAVGVNKGRKYKLNLARNKK